MHYLWLIFAGSAIAFLIGTRTFVTHLPTWVIGLSDVVWATGHVLVLVGTIVMWRRKSVGPILAAVGLGMVAVASLGVELTAFLASVYIAPGPLTYLIDVCTVLSLLFVLLPGTSRYLKTHRPALWSRSAPNTARDEDHLRPAQAWAATGCPAFDQR